MLVVDISLFDYRWDPDTMEVTEERRFDIGIRELVIDALNEQFKDISLMITLKVDEDGYYDGCDTALMSTTITDDEDTQQIYGLPLPWTTRARNVSFTGDKPLVRQFVPPKIHKTVVMEKRQTHWYGPNDVLWQKEQEFQHEKGKHSSTMKKATNSRSLYQK